MGGQDLLGQGGRAVVGVARLLDAAAAEAVRRRSALLVAVLDEAHAVAPAHELLVRVDAGPVAAEPHHEEPDQPGNREVLAQRRGLDAVGLLPVVEAERRRDRDALLGGREAHGALGIGRRTGRALDAVAQRQDAGARDPAHVRGAGFHGAASHIRHAPRLRRHAHLRRRSRHEPTRPPPPARRRPRDPARAARPERCAGRGHDRRGPATGRRRRRPR